MPDSGLLVVMLIMVLLGCGAALIYFQFPGLFNDVEDFVSDSVSSIMETNESVDYPAFDVFYEYNHPSTESWLAWVLSCDKRTQEIAFNRLADYLQRPVADLSVITADVIEAVVELRHPNSFDALCDFVYAARAFWTKNVSSRVFYAAAIQGLVQIDQKKAHKILVDELSEASGIEGMEFIIESISNALAYMRCTPEVALTHAQIIANTNYPLDIRKYAVHQLKDKSLEEKKIVLQEAFGLYIDIFSNQQIAFDDSQVLKMMFDILEEHIVAGDNDMWQLMLEALGARYLEMDMMDLIPNIVFDRSISIRPSNLIQLLRLDEEKQRRFIEVLAKRYSLTDLEKSIVRELNVIETYPFEGKYIESESMRSDMFIPAFMADEANDFTTLLIKKRNPKSRQSTTINGLTLVAGADLERKMYLARSTAANNQKSFVYIDTTQVLNSEDKIGEIQREVLANRPCIVYVEHITEALEPIRMGRESAKVREFMAAVKKMALNPNVSIIGSTELGEKDARKRFGATFNVMLETAETNYQDRLRIIKLYEMKLSSVRSRDNLDVDALIDANRENSTFEFLAELVDFYRVSLLCHGKVMTYEDYKELDELKPGALLEGSVDPNDDGRVKQIKARLDNEESLKPGEVVES